MLFSGPCHGDELPYIFHVDMLRKMDPKSPEMRTVERIVKLWTNFAKTG
jgi:carboxylesterase type B